MENKNTVKYCLYMIFAALMVFCDQLSKYLIVKNIPLHNKKVVIDKFFYLHYVQNTGSAFSFLADKSWGIYVLSGLSVLMTLFVIFLVFKSVQLRFKLLSISLTLVASGAIGNLIDRFRLKYVVDFLRFDFGTYTFPIFNFADMCAVVGTFLVIFMFIFKEKQIDALFEAVGIIKKKDETKENK